MEHRQDIFAALDRRMAHWADIIELAQLDHIPAEDLPADLLERLELDSAVYPSDAAHDLISADVLEVDVLVSRHGLARQVHFLLACGGPTVRLEVDIHEDFTVRTAHYLHSWGKASSAEDAPDLLRIETRPAHDEIIGKVIQLLGLDY